MSVLKKYVNFVGKKLEFILTFTRLKWWEKVNLLAYDTFVIAQNVYLWH